MAIYYKFIKIWYYVLVRFGGSSLGGYIEVVIDDLKVYTQVLMNWGLNAALKYITTYTCCRCRRP